MEKNATLNIRISPEVKKSAEVVLTQLGVPMATAIDIFLRQVTLTGSIPFALILPKAPDSINADMMSASQIREKLDEGLADIENGRVRSIKDVIWRRGDDAMPEHARRVVEAAQNELLFKALQLPSGTVDMIRYNADKNAQTVNEYISAIVVGHLSAVS